MASRGKKKKIEQPVVEVVREKKSARSKAWIAIVAIAMIAAMAFSFVDGYVIRATISLSEGEQSIDLDPEKWTIGKGTLEVIFAPVGGYDGATNWLLDNFPATSESATMRDVAEQYLQGYPASVLDQLEVAFDTIYVVEIVYAVALVAMAIAAIVMISTGKGSAVHALVLSVIGFVASLVRAIIAIAAWAQSTSEFALTAGGGAWLSLAVFAIATAVAITFVVKDRRAVKENRI